MLVAVLDGYTVVTNWELLSFLRDAQGLCGKNDLRCKPNTQRCKLSSPQLLNLVSSLVLHEVPGGSARWMLGRFVIVNQHNSHVELRIGRNSSTYVPSSCLHVHSLFLQCYTHRQHPDHDLTWLAKNSASRSKTHPITYTTLYPPSGFPRATCNCIIMLPLRM
jgi:hypothetical protein